MKAGTADALVLAGISKQAFNSDVEVGAASSGGPPGYQSVPFHARMARMNHLFKLADENGVILGGAILFRQGDTLDIGRIFIDPQHFRKGYGIIMMQKIEALFPDVKVFTLDTPACNTRTNAFYTRLGYSEVKRDSDFVYYTKRR
jgi:ribosomal protein S18 acetylase RimI-like enzyme